MLDRIANVFACFSSLPLLSALPASIRALGFGTPLQEADYPVRPPDSSLKAGLSPTEAKEVSGRGLSAARCRIAPENLVHLMRKHALSDLVNLLKR